MTSWEVSLTLAFLGTAFVVAYISNGLKKNEENISWSKYIPVGLQTILYFISFGFLLFALGVQSPILVQNGISVNETYWEAGNDTAYYLQQNIIGGVSLATRAFYIMIIILIIIAFVMLIEKILLKQKKEKEDKEDFDQW